MTTARAKTNLQDMIFINTKIMLRCWHCSAECVTATILDSLWQYGDINIIIPLGTSIPGISLLLPLACLLAYFKWFKPTTMAFLNVPFP